MLIIHHNDADGRMGAAIIGRSSLGGTGTVKYMEADYRKIKEPAFITGLKATAAKPVNRQVFIVDFSLPIDLMEYLDKHNELVWIDHHSSCKDYPTSFKGLRDFTEKGLSGCELAWKYCYPKVPIPYGVKLIGDYDAWRLELKPHCKNIISYLDSRQDAPGATEWRTLMVDDRYASECAKKGGIMEDFKAGYCQGMRASFGYETKFHGELCYVLNTQRLGSDAFGDKMSEYNICIACIWDGVQWTVSLYSEKPHIDCSVICKEHGGGGHKGASGFTCKELPFKKVSNEKAT